MISFSNFSSNESAAKVREAVAYLHKTTPVIDGEIQADFALNLKC
jgi:malate dehydrogenase (oxaloacetate-decarboxylating)(NADP+)